MSLNINFSEIQKVVLKVISLFLSLLLYIHITACLIYSIASREQKWMPKGQELDDP